MNLLIIDDDQLVAYSLKTILEHTGSIHVLATGFSGADAIALYQKLHPDILLMDIRMQGMSGFVQASKGKYSASYHFFR